MFETRREWTDAMEAAAQAVTALGELSTRTRLGKAGYIAAGFRAATSGLPFDEGDVLLRSVDQRLIVDYRQARTAERAAAMLTEAALPVVEHIEWREIEHERGTLVITYAQPPA